VLPLALLLAGTAAGPPDDPRADPYVADVGLRSLVEWATLQLTFDAASCLPDMAAGTPEVRSLGTPEFAPGVKGLALMAGGPSAASLLPRAGNAALESRGALTVWLCPLEWTHENGGNTEFLMTSNASFYLQRQGPLHNAEGVVTRHAAVQFLMLSETTGNNCLAFGTETWPNGKWRFMAANWNWPTMSFSLDGGEFQSLSVKQNPTTANFGDLVIGSGGGEKALMDELMLFRRPLSLDEVRRLYEAGTRWLTG
jgi:hypothetical protein